MNANVSTLVALLVIGLIMWRQMGERHISVNRIWVLPAVITLLAGREIYDNLVWPQALAYVLALGLGVGLGFLRARLMVIEPLPATGEIRIKGSPWAMLLALVVIGLKHFVAPTLLNGAAPANVGFATCVMLSFAVGTLVTRVCIMFKRYAEAKKAFDSGSIPAVTPAP